jgi:alcohol dehydrogenase class IV
LTDKRKIALVTFPEARALGLIDKLQALLPDQIKLIVEDVKPSPGVAELEDLYAAFWEDAADYDVVVALGSGGAIDTARALIVGTDTGSEVTPWATVWHADRRKKYSLPLDCTWPADAIIDPELILSLPRSVTVSAGLDALSHALESIWNINANPISETFAISAVEDILQCLVPLAGQVG